MCSLVQNEWHNKQLINKFYYLLYQIQSLVNVKRCFNLRLVMIGAGRDTKVVLINLYRTVNLLQKA